MNEKYAIERLAQAGHLYSPFGEPVKGPWPMEELTVDSRPVRDAVESFQAMYSPILETMQIALQPDNPSRFRITGDLDPVTVRLLGTARCACPDYMIMGDFAVGAGNWANCWQANGFHRMIVNVITSGMPEHVRPLWDQIKRETKQAYAAVGLDIVFQENLTSNQYNTKLTFVEPDGGWIGLAIVGIGQKCSDRIWLKLDKGYKPANVASEYRTLLMHELGHNCGLQHSQGGIMNPYIIKGLPPSWKRDPSEPALNSRFGGQPVPGGDSPVERDLVTAWRYPDGRYEVINVIEDGTPSGGPWQI